MLDIMALAAYCICKEVDNNKRNDARRNFLSTLSNSLVLPNVQDRMNNTHVMKHFSSRSAIESFLGKPINTSKVITTNSGADTLEKKKYCKECATGSEKIRRKTRFFVQNVQVLFVSNILK
ncbi:hypothetical protein EVAR_71292_1 [Eumeta japonica]|uniref:PiggyBac transposable element-derived protein domain-containing protein n=1 Tax=Eumeta variegata TaxID=151549 RepID=A0A4C1T716_EUMVA|nr:hypothetical protein EVAR_71292_1 [Eumeta japonica]